MRTLFLILMLACLQASFCQEQIDLSGKWKLFLDYKNQHSINNPSEIVFDDSISLPSSLDESHKGILQEYTTTDRLSRKYAFVGKAWYEKDVVIPKSWKDKNIELVIERTKPSMLWIDGKLIGENSIISAPQKYILSTLLYPGKHTITILVNNGNDNKLPNTVASSHMWSEDTQTNWNGLLGKIQIVAKGKVTFNNVKCYSDIENKRIIIKGSLVNHTKLNESVVLKINDKTIKYKLIPGINTFSEYFIPNREINLWSEFSPSLYDCNLSIICNDGVTDTKNITTALRTFKTNKRHFLINNTSTFLRGKHDACVFPITGYPPMEVCEWVRYFYILKSFGFNHVRFHSWCPPEAAFTAADMAGFYLQPELPMWGEVADSMSNPVNQFLYREGCAILDEYGNHPSFVMFSNGNELWGNVVGIQALTSSLRSYDSRPLFTLGSNHHLGWLGEQEDEDYMVTCRVGGVEDSIYTPHVRSSFSFADAKDGGYLNGTYPNTLMNFDNGVSFSKKPVIAHETGQFQVYPDERELNKYIGILEPYNLKKLIHNAIENHGAEKIEKFFKASGALSALCYKADIEMTLRTKDIAGFQMLDIQDFPGQGTALIGMLDAFMNNKGIITPEEFKRYNNVIVPLWSSARYVWDNNENITGTVQLFNYDATTINDLDIEWTLTNEDGKSVKQGNIKICNVKRGLMNCGKLDIPVNDVNKASIMKLNIKVAGTEYQNTWNLWIYPSNDKTKVGRDVKFFSTVDNNLISYLNNGGKAILIPNFSKYESQTVGGLFTNDYWNYSMFKSISENAGKAVSPGTLGYLIDNEHPLFKIFPTSFHSDWQWWSIARITRPLITDSLNSKINYIVEAIDNIQRNHSLGVLFEVKVGKGRLLICMSDIVNNRIKYKECNQLYKSICKYVSSKDFNPVSTLTPSQLLSLFNANYYDNIKGVKNVSYE